MTNPDRRAFIDGIRAHPDDSIRRGVFADWLDEHGEPELATLIRLEEELFRERARMGCHAAKSSTFRKLQREAMRANMVHRLVPLHHHEAYLLLLGTPPWLTKSRGLITRVRCGWDWWRTNGPLVARLEPVRTVELPEFEPVQVRTFGGELLDEWRWFRAYRPPNSVDMASDLADELFDRLTGGTLNEWNWIRWYETANAAHTALSAAALSWALDQPDPE